MRSSVPSTRGCQICIKGRAGPPSVRAVWGGGSKLCGPVNYTIFLKDVKKNQRKSKERKTLNMINNYQEEQPIRPEVVMTKEFFSLPVFKSLGNFCSQTWSNKHSSQGGWLGSSETDWASLLLDSWVWMDQFVHSDWCQQVCITFWWAQETVTTL